MYPDTNLGMTGCTGSCGGSAPGCPIPERCPDGSGTLPECAPLAVPYVPFQQTGSKRYTQQEALNNGTLFPGLNLPFHLKPEAANVVNGSLAASRRWNSSWWNWVSIWTPIRAMQRHLSFTGSTQLWKKRGGRSTRPCTGHSISVQQRNRSPGPNGLAIHGPGMYPKGGSADVRL